MKKRKFYNVIVCFLLIVAVFLPKSIDAAPTDLVSVPDTNLRSTINTLLGQTAGSDITEAQMETLTSLTLTNVDIADLTGIEHAVNLTYFRMTQNNVTNLDVLTSLVKLESLNLAGSNITSSIFPDLSNITTLTHIDLDDAAVDNAVLDKLATIKSLTYIQIQRNMSITTIAPLTALPNLGTIFIQFSGVADFTVINDMSPSLTQLYAFGQNTGRIDPPTVRERTALSYDPTAQTIYLSFASMPNVKTNFDGQRSPLTTTVSDTYMEMNGQEIDSTRLAIDSNGVTISGVTLDEYKGIDQILYNARYNQPSGSYATPPNFTNYVISSGTYYHLFDIVDNPIITANSPIYYWQDFSVDEATFLSDIDAQTNDGTPITSDFIEKVNFATPGTYEVTLNAKTVDGVEAIPIVIEVIIQARPTITAKDEISYYQFSTVSEADFLKDIEATTEATNTIVSNFLTAVDFANINDYQVIVYAINAQGIKSVEKEVTVHIIPHDIERFALSFDLNGGTGEVPAVQTLTTGTLATEPIEPTRDGYEFLGWNETKDGSAPMWNFSLSLMPDHDITLYARWQSKKEPVTTYTVQFDLNGAKGTPPSMQTIQEGSLVVQPKAPTREGYEFKGWNTSSDGTGILWQFNENRITAANLTLYAQWVKKELPNTGISSSYTAVGLGILCLGLMIIDKRTRLN